MQTDHPVVSQAQWNAAREALLRREKELTRAQDALARERLALPWVRVSKPYRFEGPDGVLDLPTTWAALDCPGGWAADFTAQTMVLGRMTAEVLRRPAAGEALVASGLLRGRDGRKFRTATALHTADGELLGRAEQVWIEIDRARFA